MSEEKEVKAAKVQASASVTAAWIVGILGCVGVALAAAIALGMPFAQRLANPANPTPVIVVVVTAAPPTASQSQATVQPTTAASQAPPTKTPMPPTAAPAVTSPTANVDTIAGSWTGIEGYPDGHLQTRVDLSIQRDCKIGNVCGKVSFPEISCAGNLVLTKIESETFVFLEQIVSGGAGCTNVSGGSDYLRLLANGTLSLAYRFADGKAGASGFLQRQ